MRLISKLIRTALAAGFLSGCSTAVLQPRPVSDAPWSGSAILLNYDLRNGDGSAVTDDCTLVFSRRKPDDSKPVDVSVALPAGTDRVLVDAEPGSYQWKSISCSHFTRWMLDALSNDGFTVDAGRIAFVGRISFRFPPKGQDVLNAGIGAQASATRSLAIDAATLPSSWQAALANPYTRKPITMAMLAPKGIYRMQVSYHQHTAHGGKAISTRKLEKALDLCDDEEQKRFPYRIGSLGFTADYQDGKLASLDKSGENSFSDGFLSCIDQSLRAFAPSPAVQLKVMVLL